MTPENILEEIRAMWPRAVSDDGWIVIGRSLRTALRGIEPNVVARGWNHLLAKWEKAAAPRAADVRKACEAVAAAQTVERNATAAADKRRRCEAAMRSPIGQIALAEGWARELWIHVERGGDSNVTLAQGDRWKLQIHQALSVTPPDDWPDMATTLEKIRNQILAEEADLKRQYLVENDNDEGAI